LRTRPTYPELECRFCDKLFKPKVINQLYCDSICRGKYSNKFERYNLRKEHYNELIKIQGGRCAICNKETNLNVDHCHSTGKIRELLCHSCNAGLGLFEDNKEILLAAAKYIQKWSQN